jgi:tetratricopeptide (TPR) repeat protein
MQQDVAEQVASEMGLKLGVRDRQRIQRKLTDNEEAYDFFLRGKTILRGQYNAPLFRDAIGFLERAVALDPSFADAWAALAYAHTELFWVGGHIPSQLGLAGTAVKRAEALAPDAAETQYPLGNYYYHGLLDFPRALYHLGAAVAYDPGRAEFHELIGYVDRRTGKFEEAEASFERARTLDPSNSRILRALADTRNLLGRPKDALPLISRAVEPEPNDHFQRLTLIGTYIDAGQLAEATAAVQRAFARTGLMQMLLQGPDDVPDLTALLPDADRDKLAGEFPPLAPQIGDTAGYYLSRAELFSLTGRKARLSYDSAVAAFQRRIREQPEDYQAYAGISRAYRGIGRRVEAIRAGRRGVELAQHDLFEGPNLHALLARTYLAFGERDSAAAEFLKFVRAIPENRLLARYHPVYAQLRELLEVRRLLER